jgi:UDP-galactopyranose mutase
MNVDYLIVGTGLTGATIARRLVDAGREVLMLERRAHVGGNVHDHVHGSGIRVHTYGPHYFRTSSDELWEYANRFGELYKFEAAIKSSVDGAFENWPIAGSYIERVVGSSWRPDFTGTPTNFEEASLAMMPRVIYEKFVKGYSEKQWGVPARELSASLARRFDVRADDEPRLMRHTHQGIPVAGYAAWTASMLQGIPVMLSCDYLEARTRLHARKMLVFTGPIDELFGFDLGRLKYRGQTRAHSYHADRDYVQPCGQVNNPSPDGGPHIRTLEWKHMMQADYASRIRGTLLTTEVTTTPDDPDRYEYPFPDENNAALYKQYEARARALSRTLVCGRLGEYRYYDMDQAIARAMLLARRLLGEVE